MRHRKSDLDGVEVKSGLEALDVPERDRQKVEEKRPLRLGGKGYHLALGLRPRLLIDKLKIGGLAAKARP